MQLSTAAMDPPGSNTLVSIRKPVDPISYSIMLTALWSTIEEEDDYDIASRILITIAYLYLQAIFGF